MNKFAGRWGGGGGLAQLVASNPAGCRAVFVQGSGKLKGPKVRLEGSARPELRSRARSQEFPPWLYLLQPVHCSVPQFGCLQIGDDFNSDSLLAWGVK